MTKGFAPRLELAVISQFKRAEKRQLTPLSEIQANLLNYVAELPDPRVQGTQKHLLKDILVISILAVIGGAEGWEDMENYGIALAAMVRGISRITQWYPSVTILFDESLKESILML